MLFHNDDDDDDDNNNNNSFGAGAALQRCIVTRHLASH